MGIPKLMNIAKIEVSKLLEHSGGEIEASGEVVLEPTKLGDEMIEFPAPFLYSVRLSNVGDGIVVNGETSGSVEVHCGRCLKPFTYETAVSFSELAVLASGDDEEREVEDAFKLADEKLDIAPIIYQNVIVEVPIQPLCRPECAGLCAECGKNLNEEPHEHKQEGIDERLAPLKDFFKKENE